ncbi:hypothetical protein [Micromonospora sp. NPDC049645]|uniref:hypothetical protein n=1 Tax=Micromonospora sp. NPDC049645 TaxID=3155508 RepID=UPI00342231C3
MAAVMMAGIFSASAAQASPAADSAGLTGGMHYLIDPKTGAVVSAQPIGDFSTLISNTPICTNTSYACYFSGSTPYANQGFYGSAGTKTGSWPARNGGKSGSYTVKFCWSDGGTVCSPIYPPGAVWSYADGRLRTGTSVTIY